MSDDHQPHRDPDPGPRAIAAWLNDNKGPIAIGVVSAVISTAISDAFGGILAWLVRVTVIVLAVALVGVFAARRWRASREGAHRAGRDDSDSYSPRGRVDDENERGRPRSWMTVGATAFLALWAISVVTSGGDDDTERPSPRPPVSEAPSRPPSTEPEVPVSFVGESLEDAKNELDPLGIDVTFDAQRDPAAAGTILDQDPDPLDADASAVSFVVAARPRVVELDEDFLAEQNTAWRQGPQSVFGYPHEQTFFVKDADCIKNGGYYCSYRRKSPLLALALKRQFEVFRAVIGFEDQRGPSDKSLVEIVTYGVGNDEEGETICIAEVGPTLPPLRLRADVSGQLRLEIFYRPWRERQIPVVASPEGVAVDVGLLSPPVTGFRNLFPVPPANPRCFG